MKQFFLIFIVFALSACDNEASEQPSQNTKPKAQQSTVFDAQLDALEKAKTVEQTLQEAEQARRREMQDRGI